MKTRHQLKKKALVHKLNWYHAAHGNYKKTQIFPPHPRKKKKKQKLHIGMDHITHEGGKKKKHEIAPEKQKITSRSSAAVESGETKAEIDLSATTMAITERSSGRRRRRRKGRRKRRRRRSVFERPQLRGHNNYWPFISYHVALC